jgi:hypothetical protein
MTLFIPQWDHGDIATDQPDEDDLDDNYFDQAGSHTRASSTDLFSPPSDSIELTWPLDTVRDSLVYHPSIHFSCI